MKSRVRMLLPSAVLAALVLGGCGTATSSPGQAATATTHPSPAQSNPATLVAGMKAAIAAARTAHVSGSVHASGQNIAFNLGMSRANGSYGTMTSNGTDLILLYTNAKIYVKITSSVLRQKGIAPAVSQILLDKYFIMTGSDAQGTLPLVNMETLLALLTAGLPTFTSAGTATVNGTPALVLKGSDGSTLYVCAQGPPFPLRFVGPTSSPGQVDFTRWNRQVSIPRPNASQVVDLSRYGA
jgi:hypothetical protein